MSTDTSKMTDQFLLASNSPRRIEMLSRLGYRFAHRGSGIDETPLPDESAAALVERLARAKAAALAPGRQIVLAADTLVCQAGQVLGKPLDQDDGVNMLLQLADGWHEVLTAVCLHRAGGAKLALSRTRVRFGRIRRDQALAYWSTGEPQDKAGGYAIQGLAGVFVAELQGSYSGVVGLPLCETVELLRSAGLEPPALEAAA